MPAPDPSHCRDPPERQVRRQPRTGQTTVGLGCGLGRAQRHRGLPDLHLCHAGPHRRGRAADGLDARLRVRRGQPRRGRQCRRRLPGHGRQDAADRQPLRHRAPRWPLRRAARHFCSHAGCPRTAPPRQAPALCTRGRRLLRGRGPALPGRLPRLERADRQLPARLAGPDRRRGHHAARRHAGRRTGRHDGEHPDRQARCIALRRLCRGPYRNRARCWTA